MSAIVSSGPKPRSLIAGLTRRAAPHGCVSAAVRGDCAAVRNDHCPSKAKREYLNRATTHQPEKEKKNCACGNWKSVKHADKMGFYLHVRWPKRELGLFFKCCCRNNWKVVKYAQNVFGLLHTYLRRFMLRTYFPVFGRCLCLNFFCGEILVQTPFEAALHFIALFLLSFLPMTHRQNKNNGTMVSKFKMDVASGACFCMFSF